MTLTAPLPILDLAAQVMAGRPVTATARVHGSVPETRAVIRAAIGRNLAPLRIDPDNGVIGWQLREDRHGWTLTGIWRAL